MVGTEATTEQQVGDTRPVVARPVGNRAVWVFMGFLIVAAIALFVVLDARRTALTSPAIAVPRESTSGVISAPPELVIPPVAPEYRIAGPWMVKPEAAVMRPARPVVQSPTPSSHTRREAETTGYPPSSPLEQAAAQAPPSPAFAYKSPERGPLSAGSRGSNGDDRRAYAAGFLNPSTTVPQGTVIQAVMETALDSTRDGFARAVVSRDVSSFDGSRVLIPKGSKLFGEYKADLARGQNRALIQWHRLTRPDGSIIDVDSPSADALGRAGLKGKVDSHFFERFGGAILQSILDIGVQAASRSVSDNAVILNMPTTPPPVVEQQQDVRPTLTVRQGASVSVFVGRDLDFTAVEQ